MRSVGRDRPGEDRVLDLLDVALEPLDDGRVVVDDRVEDRPQHGRGPALQELRILLEAQARVVEVARDALADGDDEARPDEDRDLAELDLLAVLVVAGGAQDHEAARRPRTARSSGAGDSSARPRPRARAGRSLPDLVELLGPRLEHAEPHEAAEPCSARRPPRAGSRPRPGAGRLGSERNRGSSPSFRPPSPSGRRSAS